MTSSQVCFSGARILSMVVLGAIGLICPVMAVGNVVSYLFLNHYDKFADGSPIFYLINLAALSAGILALGLLLALKRMKPWFFRGAFVLTAAWYAVSIGEIGLPGKAAFVAHPVQETLLLVVLDLLPGLLLGYLWANRTRFQVPQGVR